MKLLYDLPPAAEKAYLALACPGEEKRYCIPFDYEDCHRIKDGFILMTTKAIYKLLGDTVMKRWALEDIHSLTTEVMYGCGALFGKVDGHSVLVCQYNVGRNLPRFSMLVTAMDRFEEDGTLDQMTSNEPEKYCEKCGRPYMSGTKICPFCLNKSDMYKKLWDMTKGLRLMMLFPLLASAIGVGIQFYLPLVKKNAIDNFITNNNVNIEDHAVMASFILAVVLIALGDFGNQIVSAVRSRLAQISGGRLARMIRVVLFEKTQSLSVSSIQKKSVGDLMNRLQGDVATVQSFMVDLLPTYFGQMFSLVLGAVLLLWLNPIVFLFVVAPIPPCIYAIIKFWGGVRRRDVRAWVLAMRCNRCLHDVLYGVRVVKTYGHEQEAIKEFAYHVEKSSLKNESNAKTFDTFFPILAFFVRFGCHFIVIYGNLKIFNGYWTVGEFSQINSYAEIMYAPLLWITSIPRNISNFLTSLSKIMEILEEEPQVADIDLPIDIKIEGDIKVKNVTFGYDSFNPVLKKINVDINKGEMIGIVGHSGSGKSTFINLIMRFYDVTEGEITIDDVNIKDISQSALRSQIGVVLQETHLFYGSIRDNIKYAVPNASNDEVISAARMANAHEFIMSLPQGYNTIIGERGHSLSGGERQRIAIARALIHNPRILILDEATAALDAETEKQIQDAISKATVGRTTFAIAHRLSTLRNADKLLVLDHGRVAEYGTHQELLDAHGIYYKLVMAQQRQVLASKD